MYGGITLANQNLDKPRNIPINLWVNGKQNTISTDEVSTQKKEVTAQEIDIKLRKYLQNEYNIYGFNKTKKVRNMDISQNLILDLTKENYFPFK